FEDRRLERRPILAVAVLDRGIAQAVALAPFLLALRMLALERLAAIGFGLVARLPFAAAAGGNEDSDQQPQQEDEGADHPKVRVGCDVHRASPAGANAAITRECAAAFPSA